MYVARTRRPPSSAAHPCAPRRVTASAKSSRVSSLPIFLPSAFSQVPVGPWGVLQSRVPPRLCVTSSSSPSSPLNLDIVRFWCPCQVAFRKNSRGQGASTPCQLRALGLDPCYLDMPELFRLPPPPPPHHLPPPPLPPLPPPPFYSWYHPCC